MRSKMHCGGRMSRRNLGSPTCRRVPTLRRRKKTKEEQRRRTDAVELRPSRTTDQIRSLPNTYDTLVPRNHITTKSQFSGESKLKNVNYLLVKFFVLVGDFWFNLCIHLI